MKMNKIIIPAAMLAVGVALVGSISSTLAWYQYSTKAQAAYIGTSAGTSENLQIKKKDGTWASNLTSTDIAALMEANVGSELTPITPAATGSLSETAALPASFYNSVETGVAGAETYGGRTATNKNYVQFTLNIRYLKTNYSNTGSPYTYANKALKLVDLTIVDDSTNEDLYKAVRVHFSTSDGNSLFMRDSSDTEKVETATYGKLDTDNDHVYDKGWVYEWDTSAEEIIYGQNNSIQTAYNANYSAGLNRQIGVLPGSVEDGLAVTVTIWLEGWQKLSGVPTGNIEDNSSAMWNPTIYANKTFKVGMRFQAEDIA